MIKPQRLKIGDKVAIVSLSNGILGEDYCKHQLDLGIQRLKKMGLEPVFMKNSLKGTEFLSNNPQARAQDLKDAFYDESIKGIIGAIGGSDTISLAPYLLNDTDFIEYIKQHPKIFTGFSDTTNNHLLFYKLDLVSFYGPNFINDLAELDTDMLPYTDKMFNQYFDNKNTFELEASPIWYEEREDFSVNSLNTPRISHKSLGHKFLGEAGVVSGVLLGGCIQSLSDHIEAVYYDNCPSISKTYQLFPNDKEWKDKIIFLEYSDCNQSIEVLTKFLNHLEDQGIFKHAKGLLVGAQQNYYLDKELEELFASLGDKYKIPVVYNMNFGHGYPRTIIPYGLECEINTYEQTVTIKEPFFID